ncbi:C1QL [Mytilus edulis]|uniref:C1QL n=1 Tax=Mytilus edulis TaxID=6550 RepID=A0A8S3ST61_MYTED|nr:C1QL [Mytilus edulis]
MAMGFGLSICLGILFLRGSFSKSIINGTSVEKRLDILEKRINVFEKQMENMTDMFTNFPLHPVPHSQYPLFYVELTGDVTLNKNSIVKFDVKRVDVGDNFNTGDGIFIAPRSGVYLFSWTVNMYSSKNTHTELRVDNVVKGRQIMALGAVGHLATTRNVLTKVNGGDHVWIQTGTHYTDNFLDETQNVVSSFMGIFLQEN